MVDNTQSAEVERVARAVKRARYIRNGGTPDAARIIAQRVFIGADELADAAAAMAETRLIDAEAWQHLADYDKDPIAKAVADWLTARAKGATDAKC